MFREPWHRQPGADFQLANLQKAGHQSLGGRQTHHRRGARVAGGIRAAFSFSLIGLMCLWQAPQADAQMIQTGVGLGNSNWGYSEGFSVGWSVRRNGLSINGPGAPLFAPFGPQVQPSSISLAGPNGSFRLFGGQGSISTLSSTSASVTTMNGYPGSIQSQTLRPFVLGFTPIVGDGGVFGGSPSFGGMPNRLTDPSYPTQYGLPSMMPGAPAAMQMQHNATLRRVAESNQSLMNKRLEKYLRRARQAESEGNARMARANYKMALGIAPANLRHPIAEALRTLGRRMKDN